MPPESIAAGVGLLVYLTLKIIDALLPKGYHLRIAERFLSKNEDEEG